MRQRGKIFSPDEIKTQISQAVYRDMGGPLQVYGPRYHDSLEMLRNRQVNEFDKKYTSFSNKDATLRSLAYEKFHEVNEHMKLYSLRGLALPGFSIVKPQSRHSDRENILLRARGLMHSILTPFGEDEWFRACKHGTGTSIGVPYIDTSIEAKSTLPMTCTERVSSLLNRYLDFDWQLKSAVRYYNSETPIGEWYEIVEGSRATTVPKNSRIDRMIAVEPTGNMFLQQGLMTMMYDRMRRVGLDLETLPTQHRERAKVASITSKEATIDWSSASDCLSYELIRWLLPPVWFECCDIVRSPHINIDGELVKLNMFSTMGNAVTFPLETLVFYCLAQAVDLQHKNTLSSFPEWKDRLRCSVFGDDCIVPTEIALDYISIMVSLGFIVNKEKSFYDESGFRESCGGDYLRGYDVRPYNIKAPHSDRLSSLEPWLYIIANRLTRKYMLYFGERDYIYAGHAFFSTLSDLFARFKLRMKFVPADYPDDAGFKLVSDYLRFTKNYKFNMNRISRSQHGKLDFLYCKFRYAEKGNQFGDLRYALWLKRHAQNDDIELSRDEQLAACYKKKELSFLYSISSLRRMTSIDALPDPSFPRRRRGGYVVARGETVCWTVDGSK